MGKGGPPANITKNATAGITFTPTYSPSTNHYLSLPGCTPSYDANGFSTNDCAHTYSWDSAGNPSTIDGVTLTYDALGRMVEQARGTSYTQIVYGPGGGKLALMNGSTLSKAFVPLPGGGTAVYTSSGLIYYRHSDWLGNGQLATTTTRTMYFDAAYAPYGESYATSGSVDLDFTGQKQDTVSGLYDFLFREYNANQGRWPWPDPAGMGAVNVTNPQTWNRYAYVANMPLNATDPLGLILGPWSDVVGTGRWSIQDPNLDPGAAFINSAIQDFLVQAGLNSPIQQGFQAYLTTMYGTDNVRWGNGGWQAYVPYPSWTSDNGFTIHTGNGHWVDVGSIGGETANAWWGNFFENLFSHWSWGVKAPNQTYRQCLSQNSSNYSLAGALNQHGKGAQLVAGNDVASLLFGNPSEGMAGLITAEGASHTLQAGAGTAVTYGRRTASIFNLNLSGKTGPAPAALGKTGAKGIIATAAAYKFAADIGATIALIGGCLTHP